MLEIRPAAADSPGRRERKKQATRAALHQAAWELVEDRGFAGVTIESITDRVDVAARTFFNYYSSKEEAVLGSDTERAARICASVSARLAAGDNPVAALHVTMRAESTWNDLSSEQLRRRMQLIREEPLLFSCAATQWEELGRRLAIVIAAACGTDPDTDVYPRLVVNVALVAARTSMMHWADHPDQALGSLIDSAMRSITAGLAAPTPATAPPVATPSAATPPVATFEEHLHEQ